MIRVLAALDFGVGQNGQPALRGGWSHPEQGFVWTLGNHSALSLPAPDGPGTTWLELTLGVLTHPPSVPRQRVSVSVNGTVAGTRVLAGPITWRLELPDTFQAGTGEMRVSLHCPDAASPASFGVGSDNRLLAVRLHRLVILHDSSRRAAFEKRGRLRIAGDFRFGCNDDSAGMLIEGWGPPEPGHVWAVGRQSLLRLPLPEPDGAYTVVLDIRPLSGEGVPATQRVAIGASGSLLQFVALSEPSVLALELPVKPYGGVLELTFDNFDSQQLPGDQPYPGGLHLAFMLVRVLLLHEATRLAKEPSVTLPAIAGKLQDGSLQAHLHQATGLQPAAIVEQFESLGMACELGLLQSRQGVDPASLMRFSGIFTPYLVNGLADSFPGLGRPDRMDVFIRNDDLRGYYAMDGEWSLMYQTPISSLQETKDRLKQRLARTIPFLLAKYLADIAASDKIFVFQRETVTQLEVEAVLAALALWGDPTVLWTVFDPAHETGSVVRLGPRLLCGYLDQARVIGQYASDEAWLSVLGNALRLNTKGQGK